MPFALRATARGGAGLLAQEGRRGPQGNAQLGSHSTCTRAGERGNSHQAQANMMDGSSITGFHLQPPLLAIFYLPIYFFTRSVGGGEVLTLFPVNKNF